MITYTFTSSKATQCNSLYYIIIILILYIYTSMTQPDPQWPTNNAIKYIEYKRSNIGHNIYSDDHTSITWRAMVIALAPEYGTDQVLIAYQSWTNHAQNLAKVQAKDQTPARCYYSWTLGTLTDRKSRKTALISLNTSQACMVTWSNNIASVQDLQVEWRVLRCYCTPVLAACRACLCGCLWSYRPKFDTLVRVLL